MPDSPRILVTNDDGIDSEGLHVLARAIAPLGQVIVIAPDTEYSGAGAALGALHIIHPEVHRARIDGIDEAWTVTGPPALCVFLARLGAFGPRFDLVVAGINPGANVGRSVYHSGTVGAALTARTGGVSGIAVSQAVADSDVEGQGSDELLDKQVWESAGVVGAEVARSLLERPPAGPVVVNVNGPNLALDQVLGWRRTRVASKPNRAVAEATLVPKHGHPGSYRVTMQWGQPIGLPEDSDGGAVERGYASITLLGALAEVADGPLPGAPALERLLGPEA
ncbi:MAG: 5'/3'-nucleotidase SurE [Acidimicrobiales bacterium]